MIGATSTDAFAIGGGILLGADATGATTDNVSGAVAVGAGSGVPVPGGVASGQGSIAGISAGIAGYDPATGLPSLNASPTWRSTLAATSVGDGIVATRQITGVAAGTAPTDAVDVAQLTTTNQQLAGSVTAGTTLNTSILNGTVGTAWARNAARPPSPSACRTSSTTATRS